VLAVIYARRVKETDNNRVQDLKTQFIADRRQILGAAPNGYKCMAAPMRSLVPTRYA
jgi:hypothetical protein